MAADLDRIRSAIPDNKVRGEALQQIASTQIASPPAAADWFVGDIFNGGNRCGRPGPSWHVVAVPPNGRRRN